MAASEVLITDSKKLVKGYAFRLQRHIIQISGKQILQENFALVTGVDKNDNGRIDLVLSDYRTGVPIGGTHYYPEMLKYIGKKEGYSIFTDKQSGGRRRSVRVCRSRRVHRRVNRRSLRARK